MKKLLIFLPFLLLAEVYLDFRPCYKKYSFIKNSIPVTKTKSVTFDKANCINYDPFTNMCVISHKNKKTVKFFDNPKLGWWASSVLYNKIFVGNFAKDEVFFTPALLSVQMPKNSVITDMFCRAIGVGKGEGFIKSDMIKHFVKYGYWGDVGIEIDEDMNILNFDPVYVKNLKIGDKILKINNKKASVKTFEKYILRAKEGDKVVLNINGKQVKLNIRKKKYLFTPLEHYGIKVDKTLRTTYISNALTNKYYIKAGAKIIKVNSKKINTFEELKKALSTYKNVTITFKYIGVNITIKLR